MNNIAADEERVSAQNLVVLKTAAEPTVLPFMSVFDRLKLVGHDITFCIAQH